MDNKKNSRAVNHLKTNLKYLRKKMGLTQDNMAEHLGLSYRGSYFAYEKGIAEPPIDKLIKLCDLFDVTADILIRRDLAKEKEKFKALWKQHELAIKARERNK